MYTPVSRSFSIQLPNTILSIAETPVLGVVADANPVTEGDNLTLICQTVGTPPPEVVWQRVNDTGGVEDITDMSRFSLSGSHPEFRLQISDIRADDAGVYRCLAFSVAGTDSQEITVDVESEFTLVIQLDIGWWYTLT